MEPSTRVLVLPIFRKYWLWHADRALVAAAPEAAGKALKSWREGRNLEEKLQLLGQSANVWVSSDTHSNYVRHTQEWHLYEMAL
jgi:hypothetical protein